MIQAISGIHSYIDPEYLRIINELRALGIAPTGNKSIDKSKLEHAKAELAAKIREKQKIEAKNTLKIPTIEPVDELEENKRAEMEEQKLGAMNVAELNKIFFGLN